MERNWNIIREILIATEELKPEDVLSLSSFDSERAYEISYHVELLDEAGLINANISQQLGSGPSGFFVRRLTWYGHELLDAIRDDSTWNRTKQKFKNSGNAMTFELVKEVAISVAKSALGI